MIGILCFCMDKRDDKEVKTMLPLEDITVGGLLRRTAQRFFARPALEYRGKVWTYGELDAAVDELARRFLYLGVEKGDHVGIWCEAEPNAVLAFYALTRIGAAAVMLNTSLGREELKDLLVRTDVTCLAVGGGYKELDYPSLCRGLTEEIGCLKQIVSLAEADNGFLPLEGEKADAAALYRAEQAVRPEDTACILYTSGTTSKPKAVLGSHFSRANSGLQQAHDLHATEEDRFCAAIPIFHCFSLTVNVMAACASGGCLFLPESRRTQYILSALQDSRCTVLSCVPTLFHAIIKRPDLADWDLSSLRTGLIGGSLYPEKLFREIEAALDMTLLSSLGQTEATAGLTVANMDDSLDVRAATVGHFMNHVEGKIFDPHTGREVPTGEPGEICVRGYILMQGYYGQPEETAKAIDADGWLHTGDMGCLDEAGNIHLTGRLKDLIIRGGENISPAEIEAAAAKDEHVDQCKAIGVPDDHYGEEVCLCVVLREGAQCAAEELRGRLERHLAAFKVPRYILFMESFPLTASGKIRGGELARAARACLDLSDGRA